ncbi:Probable LRR receptor-like serine/threonine-protein kinase RKF3 [Linum grandiflorum]
MNITTRQQFDTLVTNSSLSDVVSSCGQPLENDSPCVACTASLFRLQALHLTRSSVGNVSDWQVYPSIYVAAVVILWAPMIKRFKNCSAAGDASFAHEVEVIASVRHVNLVVLRGYYIATTSMEAGQHGRRLR